MIKAKAMIKAIPPLPLRSFVGVTKSSPKLSKISPSQLIYILGHPLHPRGKISTVPKWSRARIPAWLRPGPCQCPWFFLDYVTFSAGLLGFSKVFVRFTYAFFEGFSRIFYGFSRKFCGFLRFSTLFSKVLSRFFSRSFSSMRSALASFFCSFLVLCSHSASVPVEAFGFPDFQRKMLTHLPCSIFFKTLNPLYKPRPSPLWGSAAARR